MRTAELNRSRRLGCEYEFALIDSGQATQAREMIAAVLTANGLSAVARSYSSFPLQPPHVLAVEQDCSVGSQHRWRSVPHVPVELKTKVLSGIDEWETIVPTALDIVREIGARIVVQAGHHVHIAVSEVAERPQVIRSIYNLFHRFEPVIFGLVAPSRSKSTYCRRLPDQSKLLHGCRRLPQFQTALSDFNRYYAVNFTNLFGANPHLELRYHQATLDPVKARHWLRFCLQMVEHAVRRNCQAAKVQVSRNRKGLDKLLTTCGFKANSRIYKKVCPELRETGRFLLLNRWRTFNPPERRPSADDNEGLQWSSDL